MADDENNDDEGEFSVTAPENEAEKDAMNDYFEDEDPEPTPEKVDERMGTNFSESEPEEG